MKKQYPIMHWVSKDVSIHDLLVSIFAYITNKLNKISFM